MDSPVVAEISSQAIRHNLQLLREQVSPGTQLCPAVKADAYGHSLAAIVPILRNAGVERAAVATLEEALQLRSLGWSAPVLCLGLPLLGTSDGESQDRAAAAVTAGVACTINSLQHAEMLATQAVRLNCPAHVEIKVDSGMGRMGLLPEEVPPFLARLAEMPAIKIEGVYTHFATADEADLGFAREQLARFTALTQAIRERHLPVHNFHAANSAAIFTMPDSHFQRVRPGLAVYGYWGGAPKDRPALQPAMRVVSRVNAVRRLPAGHSVGYGRTFIASRESLVGVIPIGYGDGYRRTLGNRAVVTLEAVRGRPRRLVPVIGRVSMDQITVDVTDVPDVRAADPVILIDNDPAAPNSVESLARQLESIPYEITCLLGSRVKRVLV